MYEKLKKEMARQRIAANRLAIKANITPSDFYNAMKGNKPFYPKWRERTAKALGVEVSDIFEE